MAWFKKEKTPKQPQTDRRVKMPEGLWVKCKACKEMVYKREVVLNANVCPKCNYHFRISARERLELLLDDGRFEEFDADIAPVDELDFRWSRCKTIDVEDDKEGKTLHEITSELNMRWDRTRFVVNGSPLSPERAERYRVRKRDEILMEETLSYAEELAGKQRKTGLRDALISCTGKIGGRPVIIGAMEYDFIGGSMGSVVGEKVTRCAERAIRERCPLIVVASSGGARMQEGALSLMQMAKVSAALARLDEAGLPFISILTDPTTGGVTASFAMLGDLNIAEPRALIGFAGPRVIEQTIRQTLPEGFQRSEFVQQHGMIDMVVERSRMREVLIRALGFASDVRSAVAPSGSTSNV